MSRDAPTWDRAALEPIVQLAARAPSIHNTQPWTWVLRPDGLDLRADRERQLRVADPDGHSLLISCGAALCSTEVALRAAGWKVTTDRLPDPADRDLLARLSAPRRAAPTAGDEARAAAAQRRQSDRRPFTIEAVPDETIESLRRSAEGDAVYAHFPTRADEQLELAVAVSWADRIERKDDAYIAEMQRWVRDKDVTVDGIPVAVVPHVEAGHARRTDVPLRDFEMGVSGQVLIAQDVDEHPLIVVVMTNSDTAAQQLRAGESMMRLLLHAEELGIASCPLSQAVDLVAFRSRIQMLMGWTGHPQMMLRLGFPTTSATPLPRTPRRPVVDVLRDGG